MVRPEEYLVATGLAQSDLKLFESDIVQFWMEVVLGQVAEERKADHFDLGSLIDNILLFKENLKNYYIMTQFKAVGKEKEIVDKVVEYITAQTQLDVEQKKTTVAALDKSKWGELSMFETEIVKACDSINWQPNWKLQTKIDKIKENGREYFEQLKEAGTRQVVSMDIWNEAQHRMEYIKTDDSTRSIFQLLQGEVNEKQAKRYKVYKTHALYGTDPVTGEPIKGLMDFFIEDTKMKEIWPWDLKTSRTLAKFLADYRSLRYGRQGAFYTNLLRINFPTHKIHEFQFLVIPTKSQEMPEVFRMSESEIIANTDGAEHPSGYHVPGFRELITDIQWHRQYDKWKHRKKYYESGFNLITGNLNVDPALLVDSEEVIF